MWTERSVEGREERARGLGEVLMGGPRGAGLACQWVREACGAAQTCGPKAVRMTRVHDAG
jgi:hypothetical protein